MIREMDILGMLIPVAMIAGVSVAIIAYQNFDTDMASMGIIGGGLTVVLGILGYELTMRMKMRKKLEDLKK
ncbi:MAG: hypothetical protein ACXQT1_03125 [Methermicoccaceae archaeon]